MTLEMLMVIAQLCHFGGSTAKAEATCQKEFIKCVDVGRKDKSVLAAEMALYECVEKREIK